MAVLRLRDHKAGDQSAKCQGEPQLSGYPRRSQAQQHHRQSEQLADAKPRDLSQDRRKNQPRCGDYGDDDDSRLYQCHEHGAQHRAAVRREHWDQQHHRDQAEVLHHGDRRGHASLRRVDLAALRENLQRHGRAGMNQQEADEDSLRPGEAGRYGDAADDRRGQRDLHAAHQQRAAASADEPADRQLEADAEEEQDDTDLSELVYLGGGTNEAGAVRAEQHAGNQEADDARHAQLLQEKDDRNGRREQNDQVA